MTGRVLVLLGVLMATVAYRPLQSAGFVYEDQQYLDDAVAPLSVGQVLKPRGLTSLTFRWDRAWHDGQPAQYHAINVAIHLAVGALVYPLGVGLGLSPWGAGVASLAFLLHPLNSQAVSYLGGRADLIATLGAVLAVLIVLSGPIRGWRLWATAGALLLAMGGKETGFMAFGLIALVTLIRKREPLPRLLWLVALGILLRVIQRTMWGNVYLEASDRSVLGYAALQSGAIVHFLGLAIWPVGLSVIHDWELLPRAFAYASVIGLGLSAIGLWRLRDRAPRWSLAGLWVLVSLAPRFVVRMPELLHEHQLYMAMIGICLSLGLLASLGEKGSACATV